MSSGSEFAVPPAPMEQFEYFSGQFKLALSGLSSLHAENHAAWEERGWSSAYNRYFDIAGQFDESQRDEMMRQIHPELTATLGIIEAHSLEVTDRREELIAMAHGARKQALAALGDHYGAKIDPSTDLARQVSEAYEHASQLRHDKLDGKSLSPVYEGPFTEHLMGAVADAVGVPRKGRNWVAKVFGSIGSIDAWQHDLTI